MNKIPHKSWSIDLLKSNNILLKSSSLEKLIKKFIKIDTTQGLNTNFSYPLIRSIAGVSIEIGELIIIPTTINPILEMLSDFVVPSIKGKSYVHQDIKKLEKWTSNFSLEAPDFRSCEGYQFNNELIEFYDDEEFDMKILQFKYKEFSQSTFLLYRFSFFKANDEFFIVLSKFF